ncbi:MAG: hypothetical protein AAF639_10415 [Chloroflexota bacterium]
MSESTSNEKSSKTLWDMLMYRILKGIMVPVNISVRDETFASNEPPRIDTILGHDAKQWTVEQKSVLPDGIRDRHCQHHLLEFKITESMSKQALKQAIVYDFTYPQNHKLKEHQFQTYIISSRTPQKANLKKWGYKVSNTPGVYVSTVEPNDDIVLIVLNKLRKLPHNSYFQLFASEKKVRDWAFEQVLRTHASGLSTDEGVSYILTEVFALAKAYELELKELQEDQMDVERLLTIGAEYRQNFIAAATLEERLVGVKSEELLSMFKPEERLMGLRPEERLMGLRPEERLMGLRPEEVFTMFKPEERLVGLGVAEKRLLLKQLEESLKADEAEILEEASDDEVADDVTSLEDGLSDEQTKDAL